MYMNALQFSGNALLKKDGKNIFASRTDGQDSAIIAQLTKIANQSDAANFSRGKDKTVFDHGKLIYSFGDTYLCLLPNEPGGVTAKIGQGSMSGRELNLDLTHKTVANDQVEALGQLREAVNAKLKLTSADQTELEEQQQAHLKALLDVRA